MDYMLIILIIIAALAAVIVAIAAPGVIRDRREWLAWRRYERSMLLLTAEFDRFRGATDRATDAFEGFARAFENEWVTP